MDGGSPYRERGRSAMTKKIVLIVIGALVLLCGLGTIVPCAILVAATGGDGVIESGYHRLSTETPALVSPTEQVASAASIPTSGFGSTTISINARASDGPIFLGLAEAADVDNYLSGV